MRVLAHISDVHFGREDPRLVRDLLDALEEAKPHAIALSGDLTQRARVHQFERARDFIRALPSRPLIVVPGNHDVSATNLVERLVRPLARYHRYITTDMEPFYQDEEIAMVGLNTVRALSRKDGRINEAQVADACGLMTSLESKLVRIVVTHHPFDLMETDKKNALVGRAAMAMAGFAGCKVDMFLSGHLHTGLTVATNSRYKIPGHSAIMAQAGTAVSTRTRGESNSWNLIKIDRPTIEVQRMLWDPELERFIPAAIDVFRHAEGGWALVKGPDLILSSEPAASL
jgi:3',5'-cyclic AMP phosphodiesterase CpdA